MRRYLTCCVVLLDSISFQFISGSAIEVSTGVYEMTGSGRAKDQECSTSIWCIGEKQVTVLIERF